MFFIFSCKERIVGKLASALESHTGKLHVN